MYENLRKLRREKGYSQETFGGLFGYNKTTYAGYETGKSDPQSNFWVKIAEHFQVSIDYLMDLTDDMHGTKYGDKSPLDLKYAALDAHGKKLVDAVIDIETDRKAEQQDAVQEEQKPKTKIIPLFPAAAGPGEQQDGNAFESHEVPAMSKADFAVRVSGDSMEPELHHGDIVLCKKRPPMEGELAAVMVNGFLYVKQVEPDRFGGLHLLSINRARKNLDVHISPESTDTVKIYGTLLHRLMPPINYQD